MMFAIKLKFLFTFSIFLFIDNNRTGEKHSNFQNERKHNFKTNSKRNKRSIVHMTENQLEIGL